MQLADEFVAFVESLVPGVSGSWRGATVAEIEEIEDFTDAELPGFYRWFLENMGGDPGKFGHPAFDFRASTVLGLHARLSIPDDERRLLIGCNPDPVMPRLDFLDLDQPVRDDARLITRMVDSDVFDEDFETFREALAFGFMLRAGVRAMPQRCWGSFSSDALAEPIEDALVALGWTSQLTTGPHCGLFFRGEAKLALSSQMGDDALPFTYFRVGAADEIEIRSALGEVGQRTDTEIRVFEWDPALDADHTRSPS